MDVAILIAESPPQEGVTALLEAHHRLGHAARIINLSEVSIVAGRHARYPGGFPDIAHSRASAAWGLAAQEAIEAQIPIVNATAGQQAGRDKWICASRLAAAGVAAPPTMLRTPGLTADQVCEAIGDDVVMKPTTGFGGRGVVRCCGHQEIEAAMERGSGEGLYVLQPYLRAGGRDLRAVAVGGRLVAAMERQAPPGEFRANVALGASTKPIRLDPLTERLAISAAQACGLEIAGVDIVDTLDGPLVIEVNTNAGGLEHMYALTGVDVAREMAAHVAACLR